jgi:hypothetical protein
VSGPGVFRAAVWVVQRDLRLATRRPAQVLQPLAFFAVVTLLFPLGYTPELAKLRAIAPGGRVARLDARARVFVPRRRRRWHP